MNKILLTAVFAVTVSATSAQSLADSLLLYYPFNGDSIDYSGNGLGASITGATFVADRFGTPNSALYFDGTDDFVVLPNDSSLKPDFPVSFSFWVNVNSLNQSQNKFVSTEFEYDNYSGFWITTSADNTGKVTAHYGENSGNAVSATRHTKLSSASLTVGVWHHIVAVIHGQNNMEIYIDCLDGGGTYSGGAGPNVGHSYYAGNIGREAGNFGNPNPSHYWGTLDDFAFWNRALSTDEIGALCTSNLNVGIGLDERTTSPFHEVKVYPNPAQDYVIFELAEQWAYNDLTLSIFNGQGQLLEEMEFVSRTSTLSRGDLPSGVYTYFISNDKNEIVHSGRWVFSD
ncbi:MAG: hypothetical protein SchgKO_23370 [Schleiferiaceae bacterium]